MEGSSEVEDKLNTEILVRFSTIDSFLFLHVVVVDGSLCTDILLSCVSGPVFWSLPWDTLKKTTFYLGFGWNRMQMAGHVDWMADDGLSCFHPLSQRCQKM